MTKRMTRDEALTWLNDHLGQKVSVVLSMDRGGWSIRPIEVRGLLHARPESTADHGDELAGTYQVGEDGVLDLGEISDDAFSLWQRGRIEELRVGGGEHAGIGVRRDASLASR